MTQGEEFDAAVVGGGVNGATTALHLARGGMRVVLLERGSLCREASGVNAGTLFTQSVNLPVETYPYIIGGYELWRTARAWLGIDMGFHVRGGMLLAFTDEEADILRARMAERRAAGAPIEIMGLDQARKIEPALSEKPVLASFCPLDGYANTNVIALGYRGALLAAGVDLREGTPVNAITREDDGFVLETPGGSLGARRLVLATGAWLRAMLERFELCYPIVCRVNQVSVTERMRPLFRTVIGVFNGLLTLKQADNGTVLIGGGWQGLGDPERGAVGVIPENLVGNIRLARYVIPALSGARIVRTWLGLDGQLPGNTPLVGPMPGVDDAYVIGCVRGGFTIGPYMGKLLADLILGRQPERPLFDPARLFAR